MPNPLQDNLDAIAEALAPGVAEAAEMAEAAFGTGMRPSGAPRWVPIEETPQRVLDAEAAREAARAP